MIKYFSILMVFLLCLNSNIFFAIGSDQNSLDKDLLDCIKANNLEKLKQVVEKGANVNIKDENGATALMWAVYKTDLNVMKYLVAKGADYKEKGFIFLDENKLGYYGNLIGIAAGEGKLDVLRYQIEELRIPVDDMEKVYGSDKSPGWTPLQWAVSRKLPEILTYLISKGANVNVRYGRGSALHAAIKNNDLEVFRILLDAGAEIDFVCGGYGAALHEAARQNGLKFAEMLLERKANPNIKIQGSSFFGHTPLMYAASFGFLDMCKLLVQKGADPNIRNSDNMSALDYATLSKHDEIIRFLSSLE